MSDFSATALLEVHADPTSIKSTRSQIEDSLSGITVDVSASDVAASGSRSGGGRNPRQQLLDQSNTYLNTATDQLDDNITLNQTRNDLLRQMLDVQEVAAQQGGGDLNLRKPPRSRGGFNFGGGLPLAVAAMAAAASKLTDVIPDESNSSNPSPSPASSVLTSVSASSVLTAAAASTVINPVAATTVIGSVAASQVLSSVDTSTVLTAVSAGAVLNPVAASSVLSAVAVSEVLNAKDVTSVLNAKSVVNVLNAAAASKVLTAVAVTNVLNAKAVSDLLTAVSLSKLVTPVPASELVKDGASGSDSGSGSGSGGDLGAKIGAIIAGTGAGLSTGLLSGGGLGNILSGGGSGAASASLGPLGLLGPAFASEALTDKDVPNNLVTQSPGIPDPSPSGPVTDYLTSPYSALQELGAPELDDPSSPYSDAPGNGGGASVTINNTTRVENSGGNDDRDVERVVEEKLSELERDLSDSLGF
ncbi:hypothetical protein [Haloarcula laminariae]|uniref:hypothetical protein n=1 Tax=Haloarcula laminariae TaxID=2961577 RepID=UPI002406F07B|nr:hypothetical protein [Halomicroarcula sp. FL173]